MKSVQVLLLVAASSMLASGFQQPDKSESVKWQVLAPPDAGFSILMPGKPKEQMKNAATKIGQTTQHLYMLDLGRVSYFAMYTDYSYNLSGSERSLDEFRDSFLTGMQGKLVKEEAIGLGGLHGRDIRAESTDGRVSAYMHMYVAKRRLYQFLVMKDKSLPYDAEDARFFSSLQFTAVARP